MRSATSAGRFRLLRYFSLVSLFSILLAALLLVLLYRSTAISTLTDIGETINLTLARTALNSLRSEVVDYLRLVKEPAKPRVFASHDKLNKTISHLLRESGIAKIKVYDGTGSVIYSTQTSQIGLDQSDNPGVVTALGGKTASKFIYQDHLNPFDREHSDANMIQSYLPVRQTPRGPILGVFEIYTDVFPLTVHTEQAQLVIFPVLVGIFLILYLLLLAVVRRAEVLIHRQEGIIRERNHTLEVLSSKLLSAQEQEKKELAYILNEETAQILSAIKLQLSNSCRHQNIGAGTARDLDHLDAHLKEAIQKVRCLAMRIRPSSLDDLGLIQTLTGFLREFRHLYPERELMIDLQANEKDIPVSLKIIIFRIVQDTTNGLATETNASHIGILLTADKDLVELRIKENAIDDRSKLSTDGGLNKDDIFGRMNERTLLSGGQYQCLLSSADVATHVSNWPV